MDIFDKEIICLFEAKVLGKVRGALISKRTLKIAYLILDEDNSYIKADGIISIDDCILIKNDLYMVTLNETALNKYYALYKTRGFTTDGKYIGQLNTIEIDGLFVKYLNFDWEMQAASILKTSDSLIIMQGEKIIQPTKRVRIPKNDKRIVEVFDQTTLVSLSEKNSLSTNQNFSAAQEAIPNSEVEKLNSQDLIQNEILPEQTPLRIISDYHFLLGREVTQNIFSYSGELLFKAKEVITAEMVEKASKYGKLIELTVHSKN